MKENKDTLGDRMKSYEAVSKPLMLPKSPLFIRVDGKAFHTFTRGAKKPFDQTLIDAMVYATQQTSKIMSGFELAYVQSDEATFMLQDYAEHETMGWYGYELNKVVSITASAFTAYFNSYWFNYTDNERGYEGTDGTTKFAMFDARAFTVPRDDAPNAFVWRQRDWERNSVQMLARSRYSQKQLHGKSITQMIGEMEFDGGQKWSKLHPQLQRGTFVERDGTLTHNREDWHSLNNRLIIAS